MDSSRLSRRSFLARSGMLGAAAALAQLPSLLKLRGWSTAAYAQDPDLVRDTMNGLVAFIVPGDDEYSVAQGDATDRPGGIANDTTTLFMESLDYFLPRPDVGGENDETVALSAAVATVLNVVALSVNPAAANGLFLSPFARLTASEKAEVFRRLEEPTADAPDDVLPEPFTQASGNFAFVAGIIPGFVAFLAMTEWHVLDPDTRQLTGRPLGWDLTSFDGVAEGRDEFIGYYEGRTEVTG